MNLTPQQMQALVSGQPVSVVVDHTDCVLIRRDAYERVASLTYDDSEWTVSEMRALAARTLDEGDSAERIG